MSELSYIYQTFAIQEKEKKREKSLETVTRFKTQKALNANGLFSISACHSDLTIHKIFIEVVYTVKVKFIRTIQLSGEQLLIYFNLTRNVHC